MQTREAITSSRLFAGVEASVLAEARRGALRQRLAVGAQLGGEGEPARHLWIVEEGLLQLGTTVYSGRQVILELGFPGDAVGCVSLLSRMQIAAIRTLLPSSVIAIPYELYRHLLHRSPRLAHNAAETLTERLGQSYRMRALCAEPSRRRIYAVLRWLHSKYPDSIPLTRSAIADIAGVSWETAVRALSPLEKAGVIQTRRGVLRVLRPARLPDANGQHRARGRRGRR